MKQKIRNQLDERSQVILKILESTFKKKDYKIIKIKNVPDFLPPHNRNYGTYSIIEIQFKEFDHQSLFKLLAYEYL